MDYQLQIIEEPGRNLAVTRFKAEISQIGEQMGAAFAVVTAYVAVHEVEVIGPAIAYYDMEPDGFTVAAGFVVAEPIAGDGTVVPLSLPVTEVATTTHVGSYEDLPKAYDALKRGVHDLGREPDDAAMWEEYWSPPDAPPEETRTIIFWPLKPL